MNATKILAKLVKAAALHKEGRLLAAATELQQAADEDLDLVQELVSAMEEDEVKDEAEIARARARRLRAARVRAADEEKDEEIDDEVSFRSMAATMTSNVDEEEEVEEVASFRRTKAALDTVEVEELDDADDELDAFDAQAAKVKATRVALAKVRRAKAATK